MSLTGRTVDEAPLPEHVRIPRAGRDISNLDLCCRTGQTGETALAGA
jgi:hypothetical protein